jgi:hypothetical protein
MFVDFQMYKALAVAVIATLACSQDRGWAQNSPSENSGRTVATRPSAAMSAIVGTWIGSVIRVQNSIEYSVTLEISGREAKIDYPELRCGGKLSLIGSSGNYFFFVETITRGEDNGSCTNGSITMAPTGDDLAWAWFGLVKGEIVTAYGTLSRKSNPQQGAPAEEDHIGTTKVTPPPVRKPGRAKPPAPLR